MMWEQRRSEWKQQPEDARSPFEVDYARIVHSASFRRLQGKTQVLNLGDSDFYRTRLTHSLEVAQIAAGIGRQFSVHLSRHPAHPYFPNVSLIHAVGFSHDLGHPPFGHGGEIALNYCMRDHGGFEGNGQTLRILSRLEMFSAQHGADLTRRTLLGVLKYPISFGTAMNNAVPPCLSEQPTSIRVINREKSKPPKCFFDSENDVVEWIFEPLASSDLNQFKYSIEKSNGHRRSQHKSFDCSIMDIADDIAYGVHDLEDSIALKLVSESDFRHLVTPEACATFLDTLKSKYPSESANDVYESFTTALFGESDRRKRFISRLTHHFLTNVDIETLDNFSEPLLRYRAFLTAEYREFLDCLKLFIVTKVIKSPRVQHLEFKGQKMVVSVFEALQSDPKMLLPNDTLERYSKSDHDTRIICDYVAGMTDGYLLKTYDRLFSPRMGSVFDKL